MSSTSSRQSKQERKLLRRSRRGKRPRKLRQLWRGRRTSRVRWQLWDLVSTSQSMVKIQHSLMRCIWIMSIGFNKTMAILIPRETLSLRDHIHNKAQWATTDSPSLNPQSTTLTVTRTQSKKVPMEAMMAATAKKWERWAALTSKWSTYQHASSQNLRNTWSASMALNNSKTVSG